MAASGGTSLESLLAALDPEYAGLTGISYRQGVGELTLTMECLLINWFWEPLLVKLIRSLGLNRLITKPHIDYRVQLEFRGVRIVTDSLLSQGHTVGGQQPGAEWMRKVHFTIENIRNVRLKAGSFRFQFEAEGLPLEFTYQDCEVAKEPVAPSAGPVDARIRI